MLREANGFKECLAHGRCQPLGEFPALGYSNIKIILIGTFPTVVI